MAETNSIMLSKENIQIFLSEVSDINFQISLLESVLLLQPKDIQQRKEICFLIERLVKQINPNFTVHMYGSSTNGMGFLDSDVDAFVNLLTNGNV